MNINIEFLFFDYVILSLTFIFIILGIWKGFINSVFGLLTWVGSIFVTIYTYEFFSIYLNDILLNISILSEFEQFVSIISTLISIPIIFLITLFIFKRVRKILSNDLDKQILGIILDKLFGAIYGILFGYVIFSTALFFTNNKNFNMLYNINNYFKNNSVILKSISEYNNNIYSKYINDESLD